MARPTERNVTRRSHHLAQLIVHKHLSRIHKKVRAGEDLMKHEGQFALDALKCVGQAIEKGKGSPQPQDWNPEALEEKLRAAVVSAKKEASA